MPSPEQKRRIKTQHNIMSVPYYIVMVDCSGGARHTESKTQSEVQKRKGKIPLCHEGGLVTNIGPPKQFMAGQQSIVVTWTILHLLTYY